jgi:integrase
LFAQEIRAQGKLLLSSLITTGMRLDEAALLTWYRVRNHNDVWSFCLTNDDNNARLKNRGYHRYIPVPEVIKRTLQVTLENVTHISCFEGSNRIRNALWDLRL